MIHELEKTIALDTLGKLLEVLFIRECYLKVG